MSDPNPNGELITCIKCKDRATFTRDATCARCRRGGKTDEKGHPKGER